MKLVSLTVLAGAALLAGCGTAATSSTAAQPDASTDDIDYATVNAINNVARSRGVQVIWFRYPQKAGKSTGASSGTGGGG